MWKVSTQIDTSFEVSNYISTFIRRRWEFRSPLICLVDFPTSDGAIA